MFSFRQKGIKAFTTEGKTFPSKTTRILNLACHIFEGQPSWNMLYNYSKTKLNYLLFKRSVCIKNNKITKILLLYISAQVTW